MNKEERKDFRIRIVKLRQAGQLARKLGHEVDIKTGEICIDGRRYNAQTLEEVPKRFMERPNRVKSPPVNPKGLSKNVQQVQGQPSW